MTVRTTLDPWPWQAAMVDPKTGRPTAEFLRWLQGARMNEDWGSGQLAKKADKATRIVAGDGLAGGGDLSADRTLSLAASGVTPGSYTSTDLTVDEFGRVTAAASGSGGGTPGAPAVVKGMDIVWINNTDTVNVPLPVGTLTGDFAIIGAGHGWNVLLPAGWTNLNELAGTNTGGRVMFKYLDASDISNGFVKVTFGGAYYGVAGIITYDPATVTGVGAVDAGRSAGSTGTRNLSVAGVALTDSVVTFGYARGNGPVSVAPTNGNDAIANTNASGVIGHFEPNPAGVVGETLTFGDDSGGNYGAAIVVAGIPASGAVSNPYEPPSLATFNIDVGSAKTATDSAKGGILLVATTNSSGLQARLRTATAPFTFVAGFRGNTQANFNGIGIVVRDTAGKFLFLADLAERALELSQWSTASTFNAAPFSTDWTSTPLYFRAVVDAANDVQVSVSETRNGPWFNLSTPNAYLGTVDAVGFAVNRNNGTYAPVAWFFDYELS